MKEEYPAWVCTECAEANGGRYPPNHISCWHIGICGWCNKEKSVTQPRDFRYPKYSSNRQLLKEGEK